MSGIQNYFHGEAGVVWDRKWVISDESLALAIYLTGDPHRTFAQDYASDVGVDPAVRVGDEVIYIRLDEYTGMWVGKDDQHNPQLKQALAREGVVRNLVLRYGDLARSSSILARTWARLLGLQTVIDVERRAGEMKDLAWLDNRPSTSASLFLSHSGSNSLLAKEIYEDLKRAANASVWFDLAENPEGPAHQTHIEKWLKEAIYDAQLFVVLLTADSASSDWVRKEILWASEKSKHQSAFRLILLRAEPIALPSYLHGTKHILIDCSGLTVWEIAEELYASVYQRQGRHEWLKEEERRGFAHDDKESKRSHGSYIHLHTEGGIAQSLQWDFNAREPSWVLTYKVPNSGEVKKVSGAGERTAVDPEIAPGDHVSMIQIWRGPVWMRSADLTLNPFTIVHKYHDKIHGSWVRPNCDLCHGKQHPLSTDPPARLPGQARLAYATLIGGGVIIIAAAEALWLPTMSGQGPSELSIADQESIRLALKFLFALTILCFGFYQITGFADRDEFWAGWSASGFKYCGKALLRVCWNAMVSPAFHGLGVLLFSGFVVGIPIYFMTIFWRFNTTLAFGYGTLVVFALSLAYAFSRLSKLLLKGSLDYFEPGFTWVPISYSGFLQTCGRVLAQLLRVLAARLGVYDGSLPGRTTQ